MSTARLLVAAPGSGQGKTTFAVGLMAALTRRGLAVGAAKVGPDYIDPGYHVLATGRPSRNLDPYLTSPETAGQLLHRAALVPTPADVTIVEGVMGLFDGQLGGEGFASSAHLAALTETPVLLVVDVSHTSRTVGAVVQGMRDFDPGVKVAGVVLNKAGSPRHAAEARAAVERTGVPVLGSIPRGADFHVPSRHLGLVPAAERDSAAETLERIADAVSQHVDLDAVLDLANTAGTFRHAVWDPAVALGQAPTESGGRPVVAVSGGRAFTFRYAETLELLSAAGAEPVVFDPVVDSALPTGTSALYLGGGFPEVHATALSHNASLLRDIREAVTSGMPTVAECAGLLYLGENLDGHDMSGALPVTAAMTPRLTLGYRDAVAVSDSVLGPAGLRMRGHEFHRTATTPDVGHSPAWRFDPRMPSENVRYEGFAADPANTGRATVVASYLHTHWAGTPGVVAEFVGAAKNFDAPQRTIAHPPAPAAPDRQAAEAPEAPPPSLLDHHGDAETDDALVNLAVNVRIDQPPRDLAGALRESVADLAAYPDVEQARRAIARLHDLDPATVLVTNGADEAFTLIARTRLGERPLVVHPQFTEPESALLRAGFSVEHVILRADEGFRLTNRALAELAPGDGDADLVVIGNPTNPTGVLHPRAAIGALCRSGRTVVVDEAFADAIPGAPESFLRGERPAGLVVVRSMTKTWGIAGLRLGYVVADAPVIERLRAAQPHWPVNHLAITAATHLTTPAATVEASRAAEELTRRRRYLAAELTRIGVDCVPGEAPFVLARTESSVRETLRHNGFAVRRGDTFPGLGPEWIRVAARDELTTDAFITTLTHLLSRSEA